MAAIAARLAEASSSTTTSTPWDAAERRRYRASGCAAAPTISSTPSARTGPSSCGTSGSRLSSREKLGEQFESRLPQLRRLPRLRLQLRDHVRDVFRTLRQRGLVGGREL